MSTRMLLVAGLDQVRRPLCSSLRNSVALNDCVPSPYSSHDCQSTGGVDAMRIRPSAHEDGCRVTAIAAAKQTESELRHHAVPLVRSGSPVVNTTQAPHQPGCLRTVAAENKALSSPSRAPMHGPWLPIAERIVSATACAVRCAAASADTPQGQSRLKISGQIRTRTAAAALATIQSPNSENLYLPWRCSSSHSTARQVPRTSLRRYFGLVATKIVPEDWAAIEHESPPARASSVEQSHWQQSKVRPVGRQAAQRVESGKLTA